MRKNLIFLAVGDEEVGVVVVSIDFGFVFELFVGRADGYVGE